MPQFFIILLKINLVLALFSVAYYLVLRRLTYYTLNRVFLVLGMLFATVYPFIDLTALFHQQEMNALAFVPQLNVAKLKSSNFIVLNWQILTIIFYVGVVLMGFRLIVQFFSLYKMHQKSAPGSVADFQVRILSEPVSPFSFWQTIYINPALHKESELKTIIAHEHIHIRQWHSLDIILAELSVVFYWFNPGVWLMKRAVKENLEFITDQKILNKGVDKKAYQYSLLGVGNLTPAVEIVNNFNLSDLKKRIKMMNAKRSSKLSLTSYLFILPVLLITTLAFTISKKEIKKHFEPIERVVTAPLSNPKAEQVVAVNQLKTVRKKSNANKTGPKDTRFNVSINIADNDQESKVSINPELGIIDAVNANGFNKTSTVIGKAKGIMIVQQDSLGIISNKIVEKLKNAFASDEKTVIDNGNNLKTTIVLRGFKTGTKPSDSLNKATFYFNGKKITQDELSKIDPNEIKAVNVLKSNSVGEVRIVGVGKKN